MVETLRAMHAEGRSFRAIAHVLKTTRNACIGKARRIGLWREATDQHPAVARLQRARERARATTASEAGQWSAALKRMEAEPLPPEQPQAAPDSYVPFLELERNQCRWPAGTGELMRFCGKPKHVERSYCDEHHARAYYKPKRSAPQKPFVLPRFTKP